MLEGVNVVLGVSGSIAAVKTVELAHELRRQGAEVRAVMTTAAQGIIHPWALEFATENDVVTEITGRVEHVALCGREKWGDVLLLAPTTANTTGKIASAVDDTPVSTCATVALGADVPVVMAPAMHEPMYDHPGVLQALDTLESWGVTTVAPRLEEGKAKIATESNIVREVARAATPDPLAGKRIIITSGATSEPVDPIRVLSNRASGQTGRAVASGCYVAGADVVMIHDGPDLAYATTERVETAAEMVDAVQTHCPGADALISAAAIADYTVEPSSEKIRSGVEQTLSLTPTPKLVDTVRETHPDLHIVGFKAETNGEDTALIAHARALRERVGMDFVVANDAGVMGDEETRALIVRDQAVHEFTGAKDELGALIAEELATELA
jgi:phosphopantothenoylcysteine decarboxylase/phosphopantothenate--cysteine ligase